MAAPFKVKSSTQTVLYRVEYQASQAEAYCPKTGTRFYRQMRQRKMKGLKLVRVTTTYEELIVP